MPCCLLVYEGCAHNKFAIHSFLYLKIFILLIFSRNCGSVDVDTDYIVSSRHNKYNTFTMTVGKHTVSVNCRNKRDGKQKAAQSILQVN